MIPKECKRLAEVDFPIAVVSKHSAREKSIRHGHPTTVHMWWARRPLAACRAMLLSLLLPDPCDPHCPDEFKVKAREVLPKVTGIIRPGDEGLRKAVLKFIGDFANWDVVNNAIYLEVGRELVKAGYPDEIPLVVDPFAGGGSIPLEALRLGCEAFASDLNPVACHIMKVILNDIPRHGPGLSEKIRSVGEQINKQAKKELEELYPKEADGATPISYLWARTIQCESPNCGAQIPLLRSFWLCKKANRKRALSYKVVRSENNPPYVAFEIFEPKQDKEVLNGNVNRAKAACLCCGTILPPQRVRMQLSNQRGGADVIFDNRGHRIGGARLLVVVTLKSEEAGRHYRLPTERDYQAVLKAQQRKDDILDTWVQGGKKGLSPIPDEPTPSGGGSGAGRAFSVQKYGMVNFGDLYTARQNVSLVELSCAIKESQLEIIQPLSLCFSKLVETNCNLCPWEPVAECPRTPFKLGALPPSWDFAEGVPISNSSGGFATVIRNISRALDALGNNWNHTSPQVADARSSLLPDDTASIYFTDPPYYDAIPYSELSDFFFVWLKRVLHKQMMFGDPFEPTNPLAPKSREIVQDETKEFEGLPRDKKFFEDAMAIAFADGYRLLHENGIGSIVFAHKTTEGWEALLGGMIRGGWCLTGSWPISTELSYRHRAQNSAALSTSVHLVCRPRPKDAPIGDWGEVLRELPKRIADWMERLQGEGVRGADLVFACIGPALEIFSRYSKVETADGHEVKLAKYLEKVWEVVGRAALEQVLGMVEVPTRDGDVGVLEEDARLTALFLWTLQSTNGQNGNGHGSEEYFENDDRSDGDDEETAPRSRAKGYSLIFDVVRRFAQPLGINLPVWENRIIKTEKGVVRLLPVQERTKQLFGEDGSETAAEWIESDPQRNIQLVLFPEPEVSRVPQIRGRGGRRVSVDPSALDYAARSTVTTLDRVHAAMLLQASGQANAMRALIKSEQERGSDFLRLSNALSALYPKGSEEKRLLDAMLLAVPR